MSRWLGYKPATEAEVERLERRLGYRLPPSFRAFLLTTNGWRKTSPFVERVRPAGKAEWLEIDDPQLLEMLEFGVDAEPLDGLPPKQYYAYDGRRPETASARAKQCIF
jgi:SMI1 / KNR4 family (SUKH-1)